MMIRLPQPDGSLKTYQLKAQPIVASAGPATFNRTVYAAAHVVHGTLRQSLIGATRSRFAITCTDSASKSLKQWTPHNAGWDSIGRWHAS
jgi:hypothetical protein